MDFVPVGLAWADLDATALFESGTAKFWDLVAALVAWTAALTVDCRRAYNGGLDSVMVGAG